MAAIFITTDIMGTIVMGVGSYSSGSHLGLVCFKLESYLKGVPIDLAEVEIFYFI
jgi:hypothetical protein